MTRSTAALVCAATATLHARRGSVPAALPQEEVDGRHQQHALAGAKGSVHHAQRACTLHSTSSHFHQDSHRLRPQLPVSKGMTNWTACHPKP